MKILCDVNFGIAKKKIYFIKIKYLVQPTVKSSLVRRINLI